MATGQSIRVLVVDDSAFMRRAISTMLERAPDIEVVGTASNGLVAIEEARKLAPDVITLDIEMPVMDGLTALRQLKRVCSASVIMISSLTSAGSHATLSALRAGASDFIAKDLSQVSLEIVKIEQDLLSKVRALGHASRERTVPAGPVAPAAPLPIPRLLLGNYDVVLIGSSTGGPPVLEKILTALPMEFPLPILVAQHMPVLFTRTLAERLNQLSRIEVVHAENGMPLRPGMAVIAQGGQHLRLRKAGLGQYRIEVSPQPQEALYKPSVDEMFASGARVAGGRVLAIVLTGMGEDGLKGGRELSQAKATILAQDHDSCAVYGMPKAVTQAGLVLTNLNPEGIARALCEARMPSNAALVARPAPRES